MDLISAVLCLLQELWPGDELEGVGTVQSAEILEVALFHVVSQCANDNLDGGGLSPGDLARDASGGHLACPAVLIVDRWPVGPCQQFFCGEVTCAPAASQAPRGSLSTPWHFFAACTVCPVLHPRFIYRVDDQKKR